VDKSGTFIDNFVCFDVCLLIEFLLRITWCGGVSYLPMPKIVWVDVVWMGK